MKKFINDPKTLVKELLDGFAIARVTVKPDKIVCRIQPKPANKVALVTPQELPVKGIDGRQY
ncbi:MAG: hypothetical protein LAN84_01080 [Acidobacteriia bacterium]|nr:hypothetical protein [Terriglobia bacterium]